MCAAIIAYFLFIFVINKNVLNRRAPAVKYDHAASSGVISKVPTKIFAYFR